MAAVELELPARTDYLALVRLVVSAAATVDPSVPEARLDDLCLAVSEACANAIDAHRTTYDERPIRVRCELLRERIEVTVEDRGGGFDPGALGELPAAADPRRLRHERGLGIPLMRVLTDGVDFSPSADGTAVRLTVRHGERPT